MCVAPGHILKEQSCFSFHFAKEMSVFCLIKTVLLVLGLVRHGLSKTGEEARRHSSDRTS